MPFKYTNKSTGQVVESAERRPDLARLARWDEANVAAKPAEQEPTKPARKPAAKARATKPE